MKMFQLKCPYCGADLEVKDNVDMFYCQYCGGKILLEGFDDNTVKLRMQAKEIDYKKYKIDKASEEKEREYQREKEKEEYRDKSFLKGIALCMLAFLILIILSKFF